MGHCNTDDVLKLPEVAEGLTITGNTMIGGKFLKSRNRRADAQDNAPLELVHTDLAGPIEPTSHDGYKYAISFTDDFSGTVSVYFLKHKSDSTMATEKLLTDHMAA